VTDRSELLAVSTMDQTAAQGIEPMAQMEIDPPPAEPDGKESDGLPFLVVGVGASAGGLEAYTELLGGLSVSPGLALLLVSHLDPEQKSHLAPILARTSKLPVIEVTEGMAVEVDHVYVIPPGTNMAMTDGHLTLSPRPPRPAPHMPIDHLFRSLATIQKGRSVGVLLSGNGTDGVIAMQVIKAAGGVTFAQDDSSARYPSMPRAAVFDGNVDHVMRPRDIAIELERIAEHPYTKEPDQPLPEVVEAGEDPLKSVINLLRSRTSVDFTHYKQTTIRRRVLRRMALRNLSSPEEYLAVLRTDDAEINSLYQDLLIRVTQFFRDLEAFEALKKHVFPTIVDGRPPGSVVRIWVAGCSTGEEVYSLAICLLEYMEDRTANLPVKLLATDLNETVLDKARAGVYLDNIEVDVSPTRLRRFFLRHDGHYQITKSVRDLCVFSRHNIAHDTPFSRLDLISCRNMLIYMDAAMQKRVIPLLHYALNPNGYLFLGSSENIGGFSDLFETVDAHHRIFLRLPAATPVPLDLGSTVIASHGLSRRGPEDQTPIWNALDVQKEADRLLLSRYAPVGVVVDETMTVLQFRGRTAAYLEPPPGAASLDLFRMLREGLLVEVRAATTQARAENGIVTRQARVTDRASSRMVRVEVIPFKVPPSGLRFFLVLFQDTTVPVAPPPAEPEVRPPASDDQAALLQQELSALREYLQSLIEEQESTNEELKSANEEILSANEELQSTNEELQTAKEEAQSANEELATVNDELRHRNAELARVNDDLVDLLSGVNIPIVMVSRDLRIRRFTPQAEKLFNLIPSDIGRPIDNIKPGLNISDLAARIDQVIDSLTPHESQVQDLNGRWYSIRIRPYVTVERRIEGASIVLIDIDSLRRSPPPQQLRT
jgi:two-component system CheB/CheR fusion protein